MAVVHYFWQKYRDSKDEVTISEENFALDDEVEEIEEFKGTGFMKLIYALLPVMPILILMIVFIVGIFIDIDLTLSVEVVTIFSFITAVIIELIREKNIKNVLQGTQNFFSGMGNAIDIVALLAAASTFVLGLRSIGLIEALESAMLSSQGSSSGFVLPLILVGITIIIVLISGSGTALFFAMVPLMVPLAQAANINPIAVTVPMGIAGNLMRAVSPVAAVVMIVSGTLKIEPIELVKRTSVPMISGVVLMFILSMIMFL